MKSKNPSKNKFVTEGYLDIRLGEIKGTFELRLNETKEDMKEVFELRLNETKEEMKDGMRQETVKILQAVDKVVTRFDKAEKDHAADKLLHDRHERRIERVEEKLGIRGAI